ncbi:MAG: transcription termination/antitermination factor NusG [Candidatus Colwellbacteria bacterium]|nr:transcription termination/antitermination factor NusG [Candidatus Colwellbacteria bacterium]
MARKTKTIERLKPEKDVVRHWYAVHTYSGYEDAVARYLKQRVDSLEMNDKIFNVLVPKEKKIKLRNKKRVMIEEKIYPGYVLVEMIKAPDSWYVVRNTPRVTGFVGSDAANPTPLSQEEVESLMSRMGGEEPKFKLEVKIGETVRIADGPFKDYDGKVVETDEERGRVKVMVPIFGRDTAVELDSLQIKKL